MYQSIMSSQNHSITKIWLPLLVAMAWLPPHCNAYKILAVFPHSMRSHVQLGDALVRHLLNAGHEITYITPFAKDDQENLTYIDVSITKSVFNNNNKYNIENILTTQIKLDQKHNTKVIDRLTMLALQDSNVKRLMEDPKQHFDLVIAQWVFNERHSGFAALFNCPYIWLFPFEPNFLATRLIDEATHPAYTANLELDMEPPYSFLERAKNLWFQMIYQFNLFSYYDDTDRRAFEAVFQPLIMKKYGYKVSYDELRFNASLIFSYSHSSLGQAIRAPANMISVGGYHINDITAPLSPDLKYIMDNAEYGVIYFSMGSNLKSKDFPKHILKELIKMFGELKQTVIWKFEEDLLDCPENVHVLKWAPQQSVLAHPNCILFLTHGGLLSTTEAIHFGVPIIGTPVYFDQFTNVNRAVKKGFGKKIILSSKFAQDLKVAIDDILADPSYTTKAKELSFIYHHRPVPPGKELVHWVEHVVATRGAPHLRSPALHMSWYQKMYVDLAAVVALIVTGVFVLLKYILKYKSYKLKINIESKKYS